MTTATFNDLDSRLVNATVEAAKEICEQIGLTFRVAMRQGCPAVITRDHKPTRLNVHVCKDGFVTEILGRG